MHHQTPLSTYRLQISADFTLHDAAALVPYLHALGADWVYLSPVLAATPGSSHGYDVVAHDRVDDERGGSEGLAAVASAAHEHRMGVLVDIVPNHVGVGTPYVNAWWWSLLAEGPGSPYSGAFDVDWAAGGGRLRVPVVGDDDLLPDGGIDHLRVVDGELRYHDHRFPLRAGTGGPDRNGSTDARAVHAQQHYELVHWRRADRDLNYRRFFAVNELAGVRVEDPAWFDATHVEIGRWLRDGLADGLRVDHPDGLLDPAGYLDRLAGLTGGAYVLVEKILETGEQLEPSWATAGTTGYDALALVERVLVDPAGEAPLDALEARLLGAPVDWHELVHDRKRDVADTILGSEVRRVVRDAGLDPAAGHPEGAALVDAVAELVACFPVYRSYLPAGREHLDAALADARRRRPDLAGALAALAPVLGDPGHPAALRFQQTSGAVMAKGVEDSAFYRHNRLTSLNEVGGDPSVFAVDVPGFHAALAERHDRWPHAMTTLSTHDTKRGEDTRARITALAEVPDLWESALDRLLACSPGVDPGFGSLLWQAVVGAWRDDDPDLRARLHGYAEKAMREAGEHTTWADPEPSYEKAVHAAVDAAFDDPEARAALVEVLAAVVDAGWSNGLAAKLVQLTMPGVPDVYWGSELWEQSLVDPDNRRPVDFERRAEGLDRLDQQAGLDQGLDRLDQQGGLDRLDQQGGLDRLDQQGGLDRLDQQGGLDRLDQQGGLERPAGIDDPGLAKLRVTAAALRLRRDRPELFSSYSPVAAAGPAAGHALAFDRGGAVTVATRLPIGLGERGGWGDTALELGGRWRDALTGRTYGDRPALADLLADLPVALLVRED